MQNRQSGKERKGGGVTLYTIVAHPHLHTESWQAAVVLMMVHVSASVCVLKQGLQGNKAITPKLTHQWPTDQVCTCV